MSVHLSIYPLIHLFIHSFAQQIQHAYCILGTILDTSVNKTYKGATPCGAYIQVAETDNN